MDYLALAELLTNQDGVIARTQFVRGVGEPFDLQRLIRRRELVRLLPGVFLSHTGEPSWQQRAVAGVMFAGHLDDELRLVGAALGGHSALRSAVGPGWRRGGGDAAPITVCIDDRRSHQPAGGYRFVRRARLLRSADWLVTPPRLRPAEATLDVVARLRDPAEIVGILADACQSRRTTAAELTTALANRSKVGQRRRLEAIMADLREGTASVLEHEFMNGVVRAHGLPMPVRQSVRIIPLSAGIRREYRDHEWLDLGLVVELDGRAFHDNATQRDRDLDRDLDDAVSGRRVIRLGWGQATTRACATARKLALILSAQGWLGEQHVCPRCARS